MSLDQESTIPFNTPNNQAIVDQLLNSVYVYTGQIHELSDSEVEIDLSRLKLISELGSITFHLMSAVEIINKLGGVAITNESSATVSPIVPVETVAPEEAVEDTIATQTIDDVLEQNTNEELIVQYVEGLLINKKVNNREASVLEEILRQKLNFEDWFRFGSINLDKLEFTSHGARSQFTAKLCTKLLALNILIGNGAERGGRKYKVNREKIIPNVGPNLVENSVGLKKNNPPVELIKSDQISISDQIKRKNEFRKDTIFAELLLGAVIGLIESDGTKKIKLSEVNKFLTENLNISEDESRDCITNFISTGQIYYANENGHRFVLSSLASDTSKQPIDVEKRVDRVNDKIWRESDVNNSLIIFQQMIRKDNPKNTVVINELFPIFNIKTKDEQNEFIKSLKRLKELGYIHFDPQSIPRTIEEGSIKFHYSTIHFGSKTIRSRAHVDLDGIIGELEYKIGRRVDRQFEPIK